MTVYCASTNSGKIREFRAAATEGIQIEPLPELKDIRTPDETGATFVENAVQKSLYYGKHCDRYLFAEDSGLEVEALNNEPGIYSARYAGTDATDEANNLLVLERLADNANRKARFVCAIALVRAGQLVKTFQGTVEGELLYAPRGVNGFGYDPLFFYPPFDRSFGDLPADLKQQVSHRAQALARMFDYLQNA